VDGFAPGPVRSRPLILTGGALVAGNSVEAEGDWRVRVDRSRDGGRTWTAGAFLAWEHPEDKELLLPPTAEWDDQLRQMLRFVGRGAIQPALWESEPGMVHLLARTSIGSLYRSDSSDGGVTWKPLYRTTLPSNNSGIDVCRLPDGTLVLASNPVAENWGARSPLRLSLSRDNGETWPHQLDLEDEPDEFSYPSLLATPRGVAVVYTWKRERIAYWHGSTEQIEDHQALRKHTEALHSGIMP
jgi:predicted neuraminidase